jgi:tetratricopeptide (TPR) repeat protein
MTGEPPTVRTAAWVAGLALLAATVIGAPARVVADRGPEGAVTLRKGWQALERGQYQESARWFEEAIVREPARAESWVGLALSERGRQRDGEAIAALSQAIHHDPGLTEAQVLLGRWHVELDRPDQAIGYFESALRQTPGDVHVQSELARARRSFEREEGLHRLATAHFVIKFGDLDDRERAALVASELEGACDALREAWSFVPGARVIAILHGAEPRPGPEWAEGLFDGRIHIFRDQLSGSPSRVRPYLRHEYAHAVIHRLSQGRAPTWLHEGLAQYLDGSDRAALPLVAGDAAADGPILLDSLEGDFVGLPRAEAERKYAESLRAALLLVQRHGLAGIRRWLEALALSKGLAQAYERVFDRPYPVVMTP